MKRAKWIFLPLLLIAIALVVWKSIGWGQDSKAEYRFVEITRGDVRVTVSSTGALQAIKTVDVGTQVSGEIAEIYVDFNDRVTKGQLIARIDSTLLSQAVRSAEADLERSQAENEQTQSELDRVQKLFERQVATESELSTATYKKAVAAANLKSAHINLERARQNLSYSAIRSPVSGIVLSRAVDEGQTVAASFSAPQLFLIAEDLSALEILAAVDESDIGRIHPDQQVEFSVQAYADETFTGTVSQVRLQPTTQENVVNYTVVINVTNPDGRLLPGMTATVDFIVSEAKDVWRVSNAALRFRPAAQDAARDENPHLSSRSSGAAESSLWYLNSSGDCARVPVRVGSTDGQYTEIAADGLRESMRVIASSTKSAASSATNPFQSTRGSSSGPPGPPPGM